MQQTIVCPGCDERLTNAVIAIRRHASVMHETIELDKTGHMTQEQRKNFTASLRATLNDTQSAWDAYRSHLIEHGLLLGMLPEFNSHPQAKAE